MSTDQSRGEQDPIQDTMPIDAANVTGPPADEQPTIELAASTAARSDPRPQPTTEFVLPSAAPATSATPAEPAEPQPAARPTPRVATVVWGLVLALIGAGVITAAAGYELDVELAAIALLALAGVGLVVGSIATSARRRSR